MLRFGVLVFMGVQTIPSMLRFGCLFLWATVHLKSPCRPAQTIPSMLRFGVLVFVGHCPSQIIMSSSSNHTVHAEVWGACFHGRCCPSQRVMMRLSKGRRRRVDEVPAVLNSSSISGFSTCHRSACS